MAAQLATISKEPAWHRRARRNRSVARKKLSAGVQAQLVPLKKIARLVRLLDSHHGSKAPLRVKQLLFAKASSRMSQVWWCRFCEVRMGIATTHCNHCQRHWKQANYDAAKVSDRSASKSRERKRRSASSAQRTPTTPKGQVQGDPTALQVFADKAPWVATTPKSRIEALNVSEDTAGTAGTADGSTGKTLTEQQEQYKQQLLDLKKIRGTLPEEMEKELQELQQVVQMPILTHKHLNQLNRLERSVSSLHKKIAEMDLQWQEFVTQANDKFNKHKSLYMQTRETMFAELKDKTLELNKLKAEISMASEGLQQKQVEEPFDQVSTEVLASMMNQNPFKVEQLEPLPENGEVWDVDAEMIPAADPTTEGETKRKSIAPFSRGATSPTKVQQHNLKAREIEARKKLNDKQKEKDRQDKDEDDV